MTARSTFTSLLSGLLLMTLAGLPPDAARASPEGERLLTDFTTTSADLGWFTLNDNVMGGRSEGGFDLQDGELVFAGRTNTNGGGFSSIRTGPLKLDLSNHEGIRLALKGDGRRYTWRLATDARWRGREISYWADFETENGEWSTANIPFAKFVPKFRGRQLDGPELDPARITSMGLMIYDNQDGPFELHLASVSAYSANTPFSLKQYQWNNRVLVVSAPNEGDGNLEKQLAAVALTRAEFLDREMALVSLIDDSVSTAGDRELTGRETAAARAAVGIRQGAFALRLIGKDGAVKLSAEKATPMSEIYALIDTMPMRRNETTSR
jgi:hypothetical protein